MISASACDTGLVWSANIGRELRGSVQRILHNANPPWKWTERRNDRRHPFPYPVRLTPVGDDNITPAGNDFVVLGKHISEGGLDFYHPEPLPHRRIIAMFDFSTGVTVQLLMELTWCRFSRHGLYVNGGRFLHTVR